MLTLLQISSTRVFLKTLLTTTDCLITSPRTSITHLFFGCFFFIKKYKSTFDNKPAKTNGLHKENKNLQSCVLLSTFPCSGHLLYFCPWYLSDSLKGKKTKYFTVHHWYTSEYTISGTDEEDASMLNQEDSHTHACKIFSSWRESKCWDSKRKQPYTAHIQTPCLRSMCISEGN